MEARLLETFARRVELDSEGAEVEGKKKDLSDALGDIVE